ncbi:MAG: hypothetical protein PHN75_21290 [Syntrophales bacterium]|nr:hypothetical protein [Syntrophales bacterium]
MMDQDAISIIIHALMKIEGVSRRLHPFVIPQLKEELIVHERPLMTVQEALLDRGRNVMDDHTGARLLRVCELVLIAVRTFGAGRDALQSFIAVQRALRKAFQAQEALFPLCNDFPEVNRYFLEAGMDPVALPQKGERSAETGVFHFGMEQEPYARGSYSLFIPESYTKERNWPLVVALHGGQGHGRDFIWTWLREARSRGFVLLAPSSLGPTWSVLDIGTDGQLLIRHLEEVCSRFRIDRERILITGMSDGGTFALGAGISKDSLYTAMAPVSCVLPPVDMDYAGGRRIFWLHGQQDWMFAVSRAVQACRDLSLAGADVKLKVLPDLAHAYPREENDAILSWFDPSLVISS